MRLVFMGTPEFAVPSLRELLRSGHQVVAVVTVPDKPAGRGLRVRSSPVKKFAVEKNLPVLQPVDLRAPEFLEQLHSLNADLCVVVAFRILPPEVFTLPPKGTVNLHASLLPKYRGAAPIQWAIIRGERETGVTTFFIEERVDTGDMILQEKIAIGEEETAGELSKRLAELGAVVLRRTVDLIAEGKAPRRKQHGRATRAPKITREMCRIDWQKPAVEVHNLIRGLSPDPGAFTFWNGKEIKIYRSRPHDARTDFGPGTVVGVDDDQINVATGSGVVSILEMQLAGRRRMSAAEFLRGHKLEPGDVFE